MNRVPTVKARIVEVGVFLVQGTDGNFYGTTYAGGADQACNDPTGCGTVFKIAPAGKLTTLHSFLFNTEGNGPQAALIQGTDGNFYGTTLGGGAGDGTVFQMTRDGTLTTLHSFVNTDGRNPNTLIRKIPPLHGNLWHCFQPVWR
jgi:uncharacterized repeat protein (TIGR03803 family)